MSEGADTSNLIATSVIGAVILGKLIRPLIELFTIFWYNISIALTENLTSFWFSAFYFYVWLCVVSHFQTIKEISDLGLLGKGDNGAVLPFVQDPDGDGFSNKTADSTVNMRDDEDNNDENDDDSENDNDEKEELESISDDDNQDDKKNDDPEDPKEDNRPKSSAERAKSARSTTSSIVADMRPDAEEE